MARGIFERQVGLKPSAMRTVAERRFGDAEALRKTGHNARANGVAYLAGFVIEILLKAKLVEKFPAIAAKRQHAVKEEEREVWSLIWRQHDLENMLGHLPEVEAGVRKMRERQGYDYLSELKAVCATWTIQARYSARMMLMKDASAMLEHVRRLKEALR